MRIAIATGVYYPAISGVAMFSHNLAVGLAKRGHDVMVLCPSQNGRNYTEMMDGVRVTYLKSVQVKIYPDQIHDILPRRKILGKELPRVLYKDGFRVSAFPSRETSQALKEFRPDVVHVQVSDPIGLSVVAYAKKHHIPVVTTEHNQPEVFTESLHIPGPAQKPINALLRAYFINRQSKSDFVTMPTKEAIQNLLLSRGKEFKVPVAAVSNGVDLTNFKPGKPPAKIYEKYGISKDRPIVLYVGRVDPEKEVGLVLEAFVKMLNTHKFDNLSKPLFVVVGDGVDKLRLMNKFTKEVEDGDVIFLGRVVPPDLYELYKVGNVFVTASEIETQGIVLIEAAATGLPLIAVDKGAVREICINNENGFLCEPKDVNGISEAMYRIISDEKLRKRFIEASQKIASEHDFEKTLDKFINIYNRVVGLNDNIK